jgi:drug/metabolite transporter (DMT)-like permease
VDLIAPFLKALGKAQCCGQSSSKSMAQPGIFKRSQAARLQRGLGYAACMKFSFGAASALSAGVLFGASTPFAKRLILDADPWMLAGLLYLGSGIGLCATNVVRRLARSSGSGIAPFRTAERYWLAAAIMAGGVVAPVLMMYGLERTAASSASLLLNLEGVFSVLLAWFAFHENFDRRVACGVLAISAGAVILSGSGGMTMSNALGPAAIAAACLCWALDNNLTRKVALNDVVLIAMFKGLAAGAVNVAIALLLGASLPRGSVILAAGVLGFAGYGLSLVLFVLALRHLGAARASAYFSIAPFAGALIAVMFFGDQPTIQLLLAGALMAIGLWLHLSERHDHEHSHAPLTHEHRHVHDEHHRHRHEADAGGEPHSHRHTHEPLRHAHPHYPDEHHRHVH